MTVCEQKSLHVKGSNLGPPIYKAESSDALPTEVMSQMEIDRF